MMLSKVGAYSFADFLAIDKIIRAGLQRIDCAYAECGDHAPKGLLKRWLCGDENAFQLILAALSVPELRRLQAIAERNGKQPVFCNSPADEAAALENAKRFLRLR